MLTETQKEKTPHGMICLTVSSLLVGLLILAGCHTHDEGTKHPVSDSAHISSTAIDSGCISQHQWQSYEHFRVVLRGDSIIGTRAHYARYEEWLGGFGQIAVFGFSGVKRGECYEIEAFDSDWSTEGWVQMNDNLDSLCILLRDDVRGIDTVHFEEGVCAAVDMDTAWIDVVPVQLNTPVYRTRSAIHPFMQGEEVGYTVQVVQYDGPFARVEFTSPYNDSLYSGWIRREQIVQR